ncbi:MAG: hypothetical protein K8Q97_01930 [Candidatus Andersenbacteria bacterium]|nr:hypothetical protein [Candidatus Andersenbacteria bacterium]
MGIELELGFLLVLQLLASQFFARFEIETSVVRKVLKWLTLDSVTIGLFYLVGHFALVFPLFIGVLGTTVHITICRKNGIDPFKATPRKKYYELRGWKWEE